MKKLIIIGILIILVISSGYAQKNIPAATAISAVSTLANGAYYFINGPKDTTFFNKDTTLAFIKKIHDTIKIPTVCPPPVICPTCPGPAIGISINKVGQAIVTYQNGSTTIFTLTQSIMIK